MSRIIIAAALILLNPVSAHAGHFLSYEDLEAIAKSAVQDEVADLNAVVADYYDDGANNTINDWRGYNSKDLKIFKKFAKPEGVDANVIYDVCLMTQDTINAITAKKITKSNLKVCSNIESVNSLRTAMNAKFFRIAERACLNAKDRFIERISKATSQGKPLQYSQQSLENIAHIVFFPADYAKPKLGKALLKALPILIQSTLLVNGLSILTGWAVAGIWMSSIAITGPALTLKNFAPRTDELFKQTDIKTLEAEGCIRIDLTQSEKAFVHPTP